MPLPAEKKQWLKPETVWAVSIFTERERAMAKLSYQERKKLPGKAFALKGGRYPIEDKAHARNALARVSQHGSAQEKATVRRKVHAKYPGIGMKNAKDKKSSGRKRVAAKKRA